MSNICTLKEAGERLREYDIIFRMDREVPFIEMPGMKADGIIHGFTTRLGGVSEGIYEALNLGTKLDDAPEAVAENYKRLGRSLGIDERRISCPDQVHDRKVLVVKDEDAGDGIARPLTHKAIDAQITDIPGIPLIVYGADCVPILFHDPVRKAIATAHAGWKGTVMGIAAEVIKAMGENYGSDPKDIVIAIGPSIGPENYEVDRTVIDAVNEMQCLSEAGSKTDLKEIYIRRDRPTGEERYMLNLWELNRKVLTAAGVPYANISVAGVCTMKHHDIFFSHRFTAGRRGLQAGIICLNSDNS